MAIPDIFQFRVLARVISGVDAVDKTAEEVQGFGCSRVFIVTDKGLVAAGIVERVTDVLKKGGVDFCVFDEVEPNPQSKQMDGAAKIYKDEKCDSLLAVGGGSPMDTAKGVGVLASHEGSVLDYVIGGGNEVVNLLPPMICIPTTYGTGSEVTFVSVVTNEATKFKTAIVSPLIVPKVAILDPTLCLALPMHIGGPCGMDALTHSIESLTNLLANPCTDALNFHAVRLIEENLREACANDKNLEATNNMLVASCMAGMAFWQTRLSNVHAMSHPVSGHYDVAHGVANAILLPHVMEFNLIGNIPKFIEIAKAMHQDVHTIDRMEAAQRSVDAVRNLLVDLNIPLRLRDAGVPEDGIPVLAEDSMKSGNVLLNPRKTTLEDVTEIFKAAY
jgi:alcohol dehydrogenase class IV